MDNSRRWRRFMEVWREIDISEFDEAIDLYKYIKNEISVIKQPLIKTRRSG